MRIFHFNGLYFVPKGRDLVAGLFGPLNGRTAHGTYKEFPNGVLLSDLQGNVRAFLKYAAHGDGPFIVTAYTTSEGRTRYMFSTCTPEEQWLNLPESYMVEMKACEDAHFEQAGEPS